MAGIFLLQASTAIVAAIAGRAFANVGYMGRTFFFLGSALLAKCQAELGHQEGRATRSRRLWPATRP
jgi:hypothetical protein